MDEETTEILNTNTNNNNYNNNKNRFSLQLLYPFLKSFLAKAVNSFTAGHCDGQKWSKLRISAIYTAQTRINSKTSSEEVTTEEELYTNIVRGEGG